jgi:Methyltransferase domain
MRNDVIEQLITDPPKLHFWKDKWRAGGLFEPQLRMIEKLVGTASPDLRVVETGAGLSTLFFMALGASVTSFFTFDDLRDRIESAIQQYDLPRDKWSYRMGMSEFTLPIFLNENPDLPCDGVLIDGGHMVHTAFVDFTYGYAMLKEGGYIFLDDLQMPSVNVLYRLMKASKFVEEVGVEKKTAAFRKVRDARLPGPWGDI